MKKNVTFCMEGSLLDEIKEEAWVQRKSTSGFITECVELGYKKLKGRSSKEVEKVLVVKKVIDVPAPIQAEEPFPIEEPIATPDIIQQAVSLAKKKGKVVKPVIVQVDAGKENPVIGNPISKDQPVKPAIQRTGPAAEFAKIYEKNKEG